MFSAITNFVIFIIYLVVMAIEFGFSKLIDYPYPLFIVLTTTIYIFIIIFQVLAKVSEDSLKREIKNLMDDLMDTISGIPLVNKNEKIIIKWDIVFKKLLDKENAQLYNKIIKIKTKLIDEYINKYPNLLFDEDTRLMESKNKMDLNSIIVGKGKKKKEKEEKVIADIVTPDMNEIKLFIQEIKENRASFSNGNGTIYMDILLNNEHDQNDGFPGYNDPASRFDGFSVHILYKNERFEAVPKIMVRGKKVNKELWFYRNIENILDHSYGLIRGDESYRILVDEESLKPYLDDFDDAVSRERKFTFLSLDNDNLIFTCIDKDKNLIKAYCAFTTSYNNFEIRLKKYDVVTETGSHTDELENLIAIGSSFQPAITIMEKMPAIISNLECVFNNRDIKDVVIH